ncbi:hypothetical protein RFI_14599, partial [Reticulomyxa filosa]
NCGGEHIIETDHKHTHASLLYRRYYQNQMQSDHHKPPTNRVAGHDGNGKRASTSWASDQTRRDINRLRQMRQQRRQDRMDEIKMHRQKLLKESVGCEYQQLDVSSGGRLHPLPQKVSLSSINDIQRMCYAKLEQHNMRQRLNQWRIQVSLLFCVCVCVFFFVRENKYQMVGVGVEYFVDSDAYAIYHLLQEGMRQHVSHVAALHFKKGSPHDSSPLPQIQNNEQASDGVIPIHPELLMHYRNKWCSISSLSHQQHDAKEILFDECFQLIVVNSFATKHSKAIDFTFHKYKIPFFVEGIRGLFINPPKGFSLERNLFLSHAFKQDEGVYLLFFVFPDNKTFSSTFYFIHHIFITLFTNKLLQFDQNKLN